MKQNFKYAIILLSAALSVSACSIKSEELAAQEEKVKPVRVEIVKKVTISEDMDYIGTVDVKEKKKYSFKSSAKISEVYVEKGDKIAKDQVLMELDTQELSYASEAAKAQYNAALAQYNKALNGASNEDVYNAEQNVLKAQLAYDYANESYEQLQKLYEQGAVSKNTLDKAKLEAQVKLSDLEQVKQVEQKVINGSREEDIETLYNQQESAKINYESKASLLKDSVLTSDVDGYVVDILYNKGEMISAGYPVVVVADSNQVVNIGLVQKDMNDVAVGKKIKVEADGISLTGKIIQINQIPDTGSLTYNVQVELDGENLFYLGQIVEVSIPVEESIGIWISIDSIMTENEDYVFVVKDDVAYKTTVEIEKTRGSQVMVSGLKEGDMLVIEGGKSLSGEQQVIVQQ